MAHSAKNYRKMAKVSNAKKSSAKSAVKVTRKRKQK